ncbi:MAG: phytoene/squalene synthase family protein [Paracoccaceae bacterium]
MSVARCAQIVRRGDPDRFLAAMAAPPNARGPLFTLYAYNLELARAPYVTSEPLIARMRLQWWRDMLAEAASGAPPRAHEVAEPLAALIAERDLDTAPLDAMAAARDWDVEGDGFADRAAFDAHIDATAGALMWVSARVLGGRDEAVARDFGHAQGVANWLLSIPALEGADKTPLHDGRPAAVAQLARDALARLPRRARGPAVPAYRAAWRAGPILRRAAADPEAVAEGRLAGSEAARRAGLLWRQALGGA